MLLSRFNKLEKNMLNKKSKSKMLPSTTQVMPLMGNSTSIKRDSNNSVDKSHLIKIERRTSLKKVVTIEITIIRERKRNLIRMVSRKNSFLSTKKTIKS